MNTLFDHSDGFDKITNEIYFIRFSAFNMFLLSRYNMIKFND